MQILEIGWRSLLRQEERIQLGNGAEGCLLMMTDAPMRLLLGETELRAESGDAIIVSAGQSVTIIPAEGDLLYDWVIFDPAADGSFYQALKIPENTLLRFGDTEFFSALLRQTCAEFYASGTKRSEMLDCLLKALLIRMAETGGPISPQQGAANNDPHYPELVALREKIYANPQEKWTVEMLCSEVNMSRSYFQLIYRETFGLTCIADVINCKMNRARDLLTSTSYTISHIAQLCGYDNEEHFMRQFKKNNGVTPTVFRREHRT